MRRSSKRATVESALGLVAGVFALVTIVWQDWIEVLTGVDPDHHNGSVEWLAIGVLLAVAVSLGADAYRLSRPYRLNRGATR